MALSQFIPDIRVSYLYTYWGPLGFVLTVTICREAVDDFRRHQRDREVNSQKYRKCIGSDKPLQMVSSSKLKVSFRRVKSAVLVSLTCLFLAMRRVTGGRYYNR